VAATFTRNALMYKPATCDRNWDIPLNANADFLDGVSSIGSLLVTPTEVPSASLSVRVTSGSYIKADGTVGTYSGVSSYGLPASSTLALWLTDSAVLSASGTFPTTAHVRLATIVTGLASVQSIVDERIGLQTCCAGQSPPAVGSVGTSTMPTNVPVGPISTVLTIDPASSCLGFFGASPASQTPALAPLVDLTTGNVRNAVSLAGPTYSPAQIDGNFAALTAKVNALIAAMKRHGLMAS
jgi:hypothetical protein